jgi:predicted DNA-binding transcriptional regulator YafY
MIILESAANAPPEPDVHSRPGEFSSTFWRDRLTQTVVARMGLIDRQSAIIPHLKIRRRIANAEYRELTGVIARTASRDPGDLVAKGVLQKSSKTGRGTTYTLVQNPDINKTNRTSNSSAIRIGSETARSAQTPSKPTRRKAAKPARKWTAHAPNAPKATRRRGRKGGQA